MPVRQYRKDKIDEPDELEESDKFLLEHEQLEPGLDVYLIAINLRLS